MVHRDRQIASGIPASCQHRTEAGCDCDPSESVRAFQLSAGRPNLLPYGSVVVTCASCTYLLVTIYSSSTANSHTAGMRGRRCACATPRHPSRPKRVEGGRPVRVRHSSCSRELSPKVRKNVCVVQQRGIPASAAQTLAGSFFGLRCFPGTLFSHGTTQAKKEEVIPCT